MEESEKEKTFYQHSLVMFSTSQSFKDYMKGLGILLVSLGMSVLLILTGLKILIS